MSRDEFDSALLNAYRAAAGGSPAASIDAHLLHVARKHASRRRHVRYLAPLSLAALLALAISIPWLRGVVERDAPRLRTAIAADAVTSQLMRIRPLAAAPTTVTGHLLEADASVASETATNNDGL